MTRRSPHRPAERATERELGVVAAVLAAGFEKAAAHRLGLAHSTVKHHLANARSKVGATTTTAARVCVAFPLAFACEGS
jgi:DNA-binding NarL/FixJ family response regulator